MAVLQGGGVGGRQNLPSPCVCYPKDPMWNRVNQEKLILNGADRTVKLHRHKPEFCLLSGDTAPAYKITIVDATFYVKKIELTLSVFSAISTVLNDKNAQYAITRTTSKVFTVPREQQVNT